MRLGTLLRQGAAPHGAQTLGDGKRTIAQAGCLLTCLTQCARALGTWRLGVLEANAAARDVGAFVGSSLLVEHAAKHVFGLWIERTVLDVAVLTAHLDAGGLVIVGIDYRQGQSSGFSEADHFVVAVELHEHSLVTVDPATGGLVVLELDALVYRGQQARLTEMMRVTRRT